jgi:hypothetical protein
MAIASKVEGWRGFRLLFTPQSHPTASLPSLVGRRAALRVHPNQVNPNAQLDAAYAAQKAAAKQQAEKTRKKLLDSASKLSGEAEAEACVVKFGAREDSQQGAKQRNQRQPGDQNRKKEAPASAIDSAFGESSISDWG